MVDNLGYRVRYQPGANCARALFRCKCSTLSKRERLRPLTRGAKVAIICACRACLVVLWLGALFFFQAFAQLAKVATITELSQPTKAASLEISKSGRALVVTSTRYKGSKYFLQYNTLFKKCREFSNDLSNFKVLAIFVGLYGHF